MLGMCFLPTLYVATDSFCYRPWHAHPMLAELVESVAWSSPVHSSGELVVRNDAALALFRWDRMFRGI